MESRLIISGPDTLCSGSQSFSVDYFPLNGKWETSSNLTLSSTTSNPTTVSVNGSGAG